MKGNFYARSAETVFSPFTSHFSQKCAFTLAEVLITLAVIGVVAAMTIPSLVQSYKKSVVETRLVKFYSTINQAINLAEVDYGNKTEWMVDDVDVLWDKYLKPYMKYSKEETIKSFIQVLDDKERKFKRVYLSDGSVFVFDIYKDTHGGHFYFCPFGKNCMIDNITPEFGSKIFIFGFWPNEELSQFKYHKNKGVEPYLVNWDGNEDSLMNDGAGSCKNGNGMYCTAIIQHNGWKIPKDYPKKYW